MLETDVCPQQEDNNTSNSSCDRNSLSLAELPDAYHPDHVGINSYDAFMVLAQAVHNLIIINCPSATGLAVRKCIANSNLNAFILNVTAKGAHDIIQFDDIGNVLSAYYVIGHYRFYNNKYQDIIVGKWYHRNSSLLIDNSLLNWDKFKSYFDINQTVSD